MVDRKSTDEKDSSDANEREFNLQIGFSAKASGELPVWIVRIPWYGGGFAAGLSAASALGWLV